VLGLVQVNLKSGSVGWFYQCFYVNWKLKSPSLAAKEQGVAASLTKAHHAILINVYYFCYQHEDVAAQLSVCMVLLKGLAEGG